MYKIDVPMTTSLLKYKILSRLQGFRQNVRLEETKVQVYFIQVPLKFNGNTGDTLTENIVFCP